MDSSEFLVHCQTLLDGKQLLNVLQLLQDSCNNNLLLEVGWELVSVLCRYVTRYDNVDDGCVEGVEKSLLALIQVCNPKEIMLGLSEHLGSECSLKSFTMTMRLCKKTICLLKRCQSKYLESVCKQSICAMKSLLQLNNRDLNLEERRDNPRELIMETLDCFFHSILDFLNGFVEHIGYVKSAHLESFFCESSYGKTWCNYEIIGCRQAAVNFVFHFFHVIVECDMFEICLCDKREVLNNIVSSVFNFTSFPHLLDELKFRRLNESGLIGELVFFHLIFTYFLAISDIPFIYTHHYLFFTLLPYFSVGLKIPSCVMLNFVLDALSAFLSKLIVRSEEMLCIPLREIGKDLTNHLIWCEDDKMRRRCQDIFVIYLDVMEERPRYLLLKYIYDESSHPGLLAYLIGHMNTVLKKLFEITDPIFDIDIGALALYFTQVTIGENNVLQESDRYMAGLNFLRFWLIRDDKEENKSGVWSYVKDIDKNIAVINDCITYSKREFEELMKHASDSCNSAQNDFHVKLLSLPCGAVLDDLSADERQEVCMKAFLTLDMMSCVIARVCEVLGTK